MVITSVLLGTTLLLTACGGEEKETAQVTQTPDTTTPETISASSTLDSLLGLEEEYAAPDHPVTVLRNPGPADQSKYRMINTYEDHFTVFHALADFDPSPSFSDDVERTQGKVQEAIALRNRYAAESNTFAKADIKAEYDKIFIEFKSELAGSNLVAYEFYPVESWESAVINPFDMELKSFPFNIPAYNDGEQVSRTLSFSNSLFLAVINGGDIAPFKVEDMAKAREIEDSRQSLKVTVYGAATRIEFIKGFNHQILIEPHRVEVVNMLNDELVYSHTF